MSSPRIRAMIEGALMVALSIVLGYFRLFRLPYGGSIDLSLAPLFIYCLRWGPKWSFVTCLVSGFLSYFLNGGISISWQSMLLDYVAAQFLLGLCGFGAGRKAGWLWGTVLGMMGRFVSLLLSGGLIWHMYMPESFLGLPMVNPWIYSALYNGSFCLVVLIVNLAVLGLLSTSPKMNRLILSHQN